MYEKYPPSLSNCHRDFLLSQLLPYDPNVKKNKRLIDGLKEYLLLTVAAEQVLELSRKNDINKFDPLVGENACQIRAVETALIFFKPSQENSTAILPKIRQIKLKCQNLIKDVGQLAKEGYSLADLLQRDNIEIKLNFDEIYLIQSYLLTKVKMPRPPKEEYPLIKNEYTDTKKIKEISSVGSMFADRLVSHLRKSLSELSVQFVQELTYQIDLDQNIKRMISTDYVAMHRNLTCLPCFWVMKVIMKAALFYKIPIVMHVQLKSKDRNYQLEHEIFLYFEATSFGYKRVSPTCSRKESPAIILLGSTCRDFNKLPSVNEWIEEIATSGPFDLLLAYAAAHRQYPNETSERKIRQMNLQDEEFELYQHNAFEYGCSMQNSSRFFLSHAYCDRIENILHHTPKLQLELDSK
ncbi:uncharacterized protein TRIADDRAFT_52828 [Trichoplax adhaerens]|uniref:Uncharacterized protein n=1 Tax=Trichoplax adhaerens TaxID=10228 RepID=B3RKM9_TRIAD|nr:predicted protein [Trichoplax adhaerens]EDV29192.1 predicted protein [Trichoplax adhaerens]|eukprot:XP_002108394.1 predicted protein [Trichoplax adhaerens]